MVHSRIVSISYPEVFLANHDCFRLAKPLDVARPVDLIERQGSKFGV